MANYNLVIDSTFRPFTFEEYIKPYQIYGEAYKEQEDMYNTLNATAASLRDRINPDLDKETLAKYDAFMKELSDAADDLSRHGLSVGTRRRLSGLQARYAQDVLATSAAIQKRDADIQKYWEQSLKDNTFLSDGSPGNISLDVYRKNPNVGTQMGSYSGALLAKQTSDIATLIGQQLRNYSITGHLDKYTQELLAQYGLGAEAVMNYVQNPEAYKDSILNSIVNTVLESAGINNWSDPVAKERALRYAVQGVAPAMGKAIPSTLEDKAAIMNDQFAHDAALASIRARSSGGGGGSDSDGGNNGGEVISPVLYFGASGKESAMGNTLRSLQTNHGNGALRATYFGTNGKANPMQVRNEARKYAMEHTTRPHIYSPGAGAVSSGAPVPDWEGALAYVRKKYNDPNLQIISQEDYNNLRDLGYTTASSYNDFRYGLDKRVNDLAKEYTNYSVHLKPNSFETLSNAFTAEVNQRLDRGEKNGSLYMINKDGSVGKAVSLDTFKRDDDNYKITDIAYSQREKARNYVEVTVNGRRYYADPHLFQGTNIPTAVEKGSQFLSASDEEKRSFITMYYGEEMGRLPMAQINEFWQQEVTKLMAGDIRSASPDSPSSSKDIVQ